MSKTEFTLQKRDDRKKSSINITQAFQSKSRENSNLLITNSEDKFSVVGF